MTIGESAHRNAGSHRDTWLALHIAALIQQSIRHADAKIATMSGVVSGSAIFLSGQLARIARLSQAGSSWLVAGRLLGVVTLAVLAGAAWQLGNGLRPRLGGVESAGPLGLVALARGLGPPRSDDRAYDYWHLNHALARIAVLKHERVRRSLIWTAMALVGISGIVLCTSISPEIASTAGL